MWIKWYDYCLPIRYVTHLTWIWKSEMCLGLGVRNTPKSHFDDASRNLHEICMHFCLANFSFLTVILLSKAMRYVFWLTKYHFRNFCWCRNFFGARIFCQTCFVVGFWSTYLEIQNWVHFASSAFLRLKGGHRSLSNSWNPRKVCVFVLIFRKR